MSTTSAAGFRAAGIAANIKTNGKSDVALVVNDGPNFAAAGVFTSNRVKAAPVIWTQGALSNGELKAVVLNSGCANACTGIVGHNDSQNTAEAVATQLGIESSSVGVCSTGLIGTYMPMSKMLAGVETAFGELSDSSEAGIAAATAIMTTDSVAKTAEIPGADFKVGGMAKGAGMLAPSLATMLVVLTTDAVVSQDQLQRSLAKACALTFDRIDSDGCMSTNDTVLLLSSGASGVTPSPDEFDRVLKDACWDLARQLIADAEGASKEIEIKVSSAESISDALEVARSIARNNLLKCALHGEDANWGRVLAAIGTTNAGFNPDNLDVAINGVWVCRSGMAGDDREKVDMTGRIIEIAVELNAGPETATVWTNDLTAEYVHENSAYST